MEEFEEIFEDLEDSRTGNAKRHELHEILVIGFCPLLSGGETCADMALFGRSKLESRSRGRAAKDQPPRDAA